ncbi:enoyl-CoA hydratase/isomerase family protein, partial [Streptomyces sp. C]|uniref:enoyl-CoA hydratase/isomerase family protein n=1 Tax=Streptomyces sp. C TaxID=253839 RepID=UPI0001B5483F
MIDTLGREVGEGAERIRLEVEDGIALLTLCRPDKLNGWSWESTRQLGLLADRIRFHPDVRAVLLRAQGRAFCAGIDVTAPGGAITGGSAAERTRNYYEGIRWVHERFSVLARLPQPVVAAVQGYCLGFGFELALMADIRIAADDAVFALPEARLGVAVDAGGDLRIAREAGAGWAKFLALTGRRIDAATAERL